MKGMSSLTTFWKNVKDKQHHKKALSDGLHGFNKKGLQPRSTTNQEQKKRLLNSLLIENKVNSTTDQGLGLQPHYKEN